MGTSSLMKINTVSVQLAKGLKVLKKGQVFGCLFIFIQTNWIGS